MREEGALFGARHYDHYDFLLSLTNYFYPNGLEHHQSSDERAPERMFLNADQTQDYNSLLSHEYTHSWNGKYRRPAGLATPDFEQPMKDDLLWVYEGLTQYIGEMISARAGLRTPEDYRDALASTAPTSTMAGTDVAAARRHGGVPRRSFTTCPSRNWESWRRGVDFYDEGWLIWLEADIDHSARDARPEVAGRFLPAFLRRAEHAAQGRAVHAGRCGRRRSTKCALRLARLLPDARRRNDTSTPPFGGIEGGGWRLVYNDTPNQRIHTFENGGRTNSS